MIPSELVAFRPDQHSPTINADHAAKLEELRVALRDHLEAHVGNTGPVLLDPFTTDVVMGKYDDQIGDDVQAFAVARVKALNAKAIEALRKNLMKSAVGPIARLGWNNGIHYCRHIPTPEMFEKAQQ